jgi:hypothetical protein
MLFRGIDTVKSRIAAFAVTMARMGSPGREE